MIGTRRNVSIEYSYRVKLKSIFEKNCHPKFIKCNASHIYRGIFSDFFEYFIQHCYIYRPPGSTVPEDAAIEPRTVANCDCGINSHLYPDLYVKLFSFSYEYKRAYFCVP
jgi:hypothetical protein